MISDLIVGEYGTLKFQTRNDGRTYVSVDDRIREAPFEILNDADERAVFKWLGDQFGYQGRDMRYLVKIRDRVFEAKSPTDVEAIKEVLHLAPREWYKRFRQEKAICVSRETLETTEYMVDFHTWNHRVSPT